MTTIPPSYMNYVQPAQTVAPTQGTPANATNLYQQQSQQLMNNTQQATQPQLVNTTNAPALANTQGQFINQLQQQNQATTAMPTPAAPVDRLGLIDTSTVGGIDQFVKQAYHMSQAYTQAPQAPAQAVAPAVAPQVVSPAQQVAPATTPVAQTVNTQGILTQQQQQLATVPPTTASTSTNANPQSQPQQTAPQAGQSDGQGNILWRNPQGQLQWMPEQEVLAMYQGGTEYRGKIQLPNGTWIDKTTAERVKEKIGARLQLAKLKQDGKISDQEFKLAGGDQDLSGILGSTQQTKNEKALARMKEAASGPRDIADLGGASPYSSFSPSAGVEA